MDSGAGLAVGPQNFGGLKIRRATRKRDRRFRHPKAMQFDLRQLPEPSPPPIKEPPEGPENPDVPVREPDPDEPFQM